MSQTFPTVLFPQPEGGYIVQCPTLPGRHSQAATVEEAMSNILDAIKLAREDALR
jgi:predicted RNase H-like HicB family nuclease